MAIEYSRAVFSAESSCGGQSTLESGPVPQRGQQANARIGSTLLGRFTLMRLLGTGSNGDVYEVRDKNAPEATVALKLLRHASPHALYRFKREFRGLAEVTHPNLVALHELSLDEHHTFFT